MDSKIKKEADKLFSKIAIRKRKGRKFEGLDNAEYYEQINKKYENLISGYVELN